MPSKSLAILCVVLVFAVGARADEELIWNLVPGYMETPDAIEKFPEIFSLLGF